MKISQEDEILIKNLYLSKWYGARRTPRQFPDNGWKIGSINDLPKRNTRRVQLSGNQAAIDRIRRVAVETLCSVKRTSQKGINQLVRFRMKLPFSVQMCTGQYTAISSSNASNDIVLCRCLKPTASLVSLADKLPYRLQ